VPIENDGNVLRRQAQRLIMQAIKTIERRERKCKCPALYFAQIPLFHA
jgi:hypothetical protein